MLDQDPHKTDADPKHCLLHTGYSMKCPHVYELIFMNVSTVLYQRSLWRPNFVFLLSSGAGYEVRGRKKNQQK
jgi:hypothetical protein